MAHDYNFIVRKSLFEFFSVFYKKSMNLQKWKPIFLSKINEG